MNRAQYPRFLYELLQKKYYVLQKANFLLHFLLSENHQCIQVLPHIHVYILKYTLSINESKKLNFWRNADPTECLSAPHKEKM